MFEKKSLEIRHERTHPSKLVKVFFTRPYKLMAIVGSIFTVIILFFTFFLINLGVNTILGNSLFFIGVISIPKGFLISFLSFILGMIGALLLSYFTKPNPKTFDFYWSLFGLIVLFVISIILFVEMIIQIHPFLLLLTLATLIFFFSSIVCIHYFLGFSWGEFYFIDLKTEELVIQSRSFFLSKWTEKRLNRRIVESVIFQRNPDYPETADKYILIIKTTPELIKITGTPLQSIRPVGLLILYLIKYLRWSVTLEGKEFSEDLKDETLTFELFLQKYEINLLWRNFKTFKGSPDEFDWIKSEDDPIVLKGPKIASNRETILMGIGLTAFNVIGMPIIIWVFEMGLITIEELFQRFLILFLFGELMVLTLLIYMTSRKVVRISPNGIQVGDELVGYSFWGLLLPYEFIKAFPLIRKHQGKEHEEEEYYVDIDLFFFSERIAEFPSNEKAEKFQAYLVNACISARRISNS